MLNSCSLCIHVHYFDSLDVLHVISRTRLSRFSVSNTEKLGGAWGQTMTAKIYTALAKTGVYLNNVQMFDNKNCQVVHNYDQWVEALDITIANNFCPPQTDFFSLLTFRPQNLTTMNL